MSHVFKSILALAHSILGIVIWFGSEEFERRKLLGALWFLLGTVWFFSLMHDLWREWHRYEDACWAAWKEREKHGQDTNP